MSQLFTYFVCSRDAIEHWADALVVGDETAQEDAQARMPLVVTIKSVGDTEFNILASCIAAEHFDVVKAVGEIDLVRAITDDEGPWITAFRRPAIQAVSGMQTSDRSVLNRWVERTSDFNGNREWCVRHLTAEAADELRTLSRRAVEENSPLFVCFFG